MTSNFSAKITVDAKDKTRAVYDSINTDNEFYPENPVKTKINLDKKIIILVESNHLPHLRANLNSTLRLVQASHDTIESAETTGDGGNFPSDPEPRPAESEKHPNASRPCPHCKGTRLAELVWGMMAWPLDKELQRRLQKRLDSGDLEECGCVIPYPNPPKFRCRDCGMHIWEGCVYGKPRRH